MISRGIVVMLKHMLRTAKLGLEFARWHTTADLASARLQKASSRTQATGGSLFTNEAHSGHATVFFLLLLFLLFLLLVVFVS